LLERAGRAASLAGLNAIGIERLREAVELRRSLGEPDAIAGAVALLGDSLVKALQRDEALATVKAAVDELLEPGRAPDGPGRVALLGQLCRAYFMHDEHEQAIAVADRTLEVAERLDLVAIVSDVLITRGGALSSIGRSYEGRGAVRAGIELADERGLVFTSVRGRLNLGVTAPDPKAQFDAAEETLQMARKYGLSGILPIVTGNISSAAIDVGEWDRAIALLT